MHLFFDTDIGTDVDDALALGVLLGSPELTLAGVSTVYGDTMLRAQLASRLASLAGRRGLAIAAGEELTRSGRPVWWPGHEGALHEGLEAEPVAGGGVDALVRAARDSGGALVVLAVGPLTNIAAALDRDPAFESLVDRVIIMGGDFTDDGRVPEHNILSDITAAQRVFDSGLRIDVGGLDLTTQIKIDPSAVDRIRSSGAFGEAIAAEIAQWWRFHGTQWNNPHDPILAVWALHPELFEAEAADVRIDDEGRSWSSDASTGRVRIIRRMDAAAVAQQIVDRIIAAA